MLKKKKKNALPQYPFFKKYLLQKELHYSTMMN